VGHQAPSPLNSQYASQSTSAWDDTTNVTFEALIRSCSLFAKDNGGNGASGLVADKAALLRDAQQKQQTPSVSVV
jgi:hypothetical protein